MRPRATTDPVNLDELDAAPSRWERIVFTNPYEPPPEIEPDSLGDPGFERPVRNHVCVYWARMSVVCFAAISIDKSKFIENQPVPLLYLLGCLFAFVSVFTVVRDNLLC